MKKLLIFLAVFLFSYEATITDVNLDKKEADIDSYVNKGISGVVICSYEKENIICASAVSFGKKILLSSFEELKNNAFATPLVLPKKGDKVIFAKNYDRILILAPDQDAYLKVKKIYKNSVIISPDVLATFIDKLSKDNLRKFAIHFNIGRYILVLDKLYEVDSYSLYVISSKNIKFKKEYKKAFFTYFKNFDIKKVDYKKIIKGLDAR